MLRYHADTKARGDSRLQTFLKTSLLLGFLLSIPACVDKPSATKPVARNDGTESSPRATATVGTTDTEVAIDIDPGEPEVVFGLEETRKLPSPSIVEFSSLTDEVKERGQEILLRWAVIGSRAEIEQAGGLRVTLFQTGDRVVFQSGQINLRLFKQASFTLHVWTGESRKASKTLNLKLSYPPFVNYFVSSHSETYARGQPIDLRWEVDAATEVVILDRNANMFYHIPGGLGGLRMQPEKSNVYTLTASGPAGKVEAKLPVEVRAPLRITRFSAFPDALKQSGEEVNLTWAVENAKRIDIIDQSSGRNFENVSGSLKVYPNQATIYTLIAYGEGSDNRQDIAVMIGTEPPRMNFAADLMSLTQPGEAIQLSWNVQNADKIRLRDVESKLVHDNLEAQGSKLVRPEKSGRYTLTANTKDNLIIEKSLDLAVRLPAVIETFLTAPAEIPAGGTVSLSWTVSGASRVELIDQTRGETTPLELQGSLELSPTVTTNYQLRAYGGEGAVERGVMVRVWSIAPDFKFTCTSCGAKPDGKADTPANLQWEVKHASRVELVSYTDSKDQAVQKLEASGSIDVPLTKTTTFFLKAYNDHRRAYYSRKIRLERPDPALVR